MGNKGSLQGTMTLSIQGLLDIYDAQQKTTLSITTFHTKSHYAERRVLSIVIKRNVVMLNVVEPLTL